MNRQEYQQQVISSLTWLSMRVKQNNNLSLTDINHSAEDFYCILLNLALGYQLININISNPNSSAIDLGDKENKIAIQVTSTNSLSKTTDTVNKFIRKELYNQYDRLIVLNIVKKTNHKSNYIGNEKFKIDTKEDIWDIGDLIKWITTKNDLKKQKGIVDFLNDELSIKPVNSISNEVLTITGLIEYISDEAHPAAGDGFLEEPFPEEKIYERFSDHSIYLQERFYDLFLEYGAVLTAVKKDADFGQVKLRRAACYLRGYSDSVLCECDGDPKIALHKIIDKFSKVLSEKGIQFDNGAAEFYIIEQLTRCNVFPKKELLNG